MTYFYDNVLFTIFIQTVAKELDLPLFLFSQHLAQCLASDGSLAKSWMNKHRLAGVLHTACIQCCVL